MFAAIIVLRGYIESGDQPSVAQAHTVDVPVASAHVLDGDLRAAAREMHPVATAIVDREVSKAAERRALLG
jgi:hypothetical protein